MQALIQRVDTATLDEVERKKVEVEAPQPVHTLGEEHKLIGYCRFTPEDR